jgi:hypothetical protein
VCARMHMRLCMCECKKDSQVFLTVFVHNSAYDMVPILLKEIFCSRIFAKLQLLRCIMSKGGGAVKLNSFPVIFCASKSTLSSVLWFKLFPEVWQRQTVRQVRQLKECVCWLFV